MKAKHEVTLKPIYVLFDRPYNFEPEDEDNESWFDYPIAIADDREQLEISDGLERPFVAECTLIVNKVFGTSKKV
jgi:hypothetical protein